MRKRLADICEYGTFIAESPACIVVFSRETKYYLEDGSAAIENILLASTALGLSTCWIAGDKKHYSRLIGNMLHVPQNYKLIALISLGYESGNVKRKKKRSLHEVLHWEKF
jgi:nitroreductase